MKLPEWVPFVGGRSNEVNEKPAETAVDLKKRETFGKLGGILAGVVGLATGCGACEDNSPSYREKLIAAGWFEFDCLKTQYITVLYDLIKFLGTRLPQKFYFRYDKKSQKWKFEAKKMADEIKDHVSEDGFTIDLEDANTDLSRRIKSVKGLGTTVAAGAWKDGQEFAGCFDKKADTPCEITPDHIIEALGDVYSHNTVLDDIRRRNRELKNAAARLLTVGRWQEIAFEQFPWKKKEILNQFGLGGKNVDVDDLPDPGNIEKGCKVEIPKSDPNKPKGKPKADAGTADAVDGKKKAGPDASTAETDAGGQVEPDKPDAGAKRKEPEDKKPRKKKRKGGIFRVAPRSRGSKQAPVDR